jgi:hypothetical protein
LCIIVFPLRTFLFYLQNYHAKTPKKYAAFFSTTSFYYLHPAIQIHFTQKQGSMNSLFFNKAQNGADEQNTLGKNWGWDFG